jgi:hypothetical protein
MSIWCIQTGLKVFTLLNATAGALCQWLSLTTFGAQDNEKFLASLVCSL